MFGWLEARSGSSAGAVRARRRLVLQRGVTALLITVLIWGQCPASLWAVGVEGLVDDDRTALAAALDGAMPVSGEESSTGADEGRDDAASAVADGEMTGASASQDAAAGTADADSTAPAAAPSDVAASADAAARDEADMAGTSVDARSLDEDCYIMVQDERDKDDSYSKLTGALSVGDELWANAYDWDDWGVAAEDGWTYQWMWSATKTADSDAFAPIEGEVGQGLVITDELASKIAGGYIAVKVCADGVELWGPASSYGSLSSFDLPGPVNASNQVTLSRVELYRDDVKISGDIDAILAPGDTIRASAVTGGSSADTATNGSVVDAGGVSCSWTLLARKGDEQGVSLGAGSSVTLPEGEQALGCYLKVEASAGANVVSYTMGPIARAGALRLANVSIDIEGGEAAAEGATLVAKPVLTAGKVPPAESVSYQWWISRNDAASFERIVGATDARLPIDSSMIGAYLKVTATAGGYNEVRDVAGPILPGASADAAIAALDAARFTPSPAFGAQENVCAIVSDELARLGYSDATVRVVQASAGAGGASVSSLPGDTNGDVTFYYEDPATVEEPAGFASIKVDFEIASGGTTATWTRYIVVRWDMDRVQARLEQLLSDELSASSLLAYEGGAADDAQGSIVARRDLVLDDWIASWADISWTSDNEDALLNDGTLVRRQSEDGFANLTATVGFTGASEGEAVPRASKTFAVTVASIDSDPTVEDLLESALGRVELKDFSSRQPVDPAGIVADVQLPTRRDLGITGSGYTLSFAIDAAGDQACRVNGARLVVNRPAPGLPAAHDTLLVTVSRDGVSRTASIDLAVCSLGTEELDAELALMQRAKAAYQDALLGENTSASAVCGDLKGFISVYAAEDGGLTWVRSASEISPSGIAAVSIDPARPSEQWDRFRSSAPSVIESETLRLVEQPVYNTRVTVTSCLSSERFGGYYDRYKDDPSIDAAVLAKYQALSRQEVQATFIVPGTSGVDDPSAPAAKTVTARVVGVGERDGDGAIRQETWIPLREVVVPGDEPATAWDIFAQLLEEAGYTYSLTGGVPYSITTPDGSRTLAMSNTAPWSYWSFLVDGEYADDYANNVTVHDGDVIELVYVDGSGTALPENDVVIDSGAERPAWGSSWPGFTTSNRPVSSPTPTQAAEEKWVAQVGAGRENLSDPILIGDYLYIASTDRLIMMDAATGATVREAKLAASIDSTARMVYADGVVIVPLHAGRLQALTADELVTTWLTQPLPAATTPSGTVVEQQSLGTLTVRDGYVYAGTSDGSYDGSGTGYLFCVNIANGAVRWSKFMAGGYYWAGAAAAGDYLVVGDDAGNVYAFDPATGETAGEPLSLGAQVRSTIVSDGTYLYAADYKGTLHKLVMGADGSLTEVARVAFGKYCTSTPALVDGKVVLCGQSATQGPSKYKKYAAVFVIDAETMTVEHEVCKTADGGFLPTMYSQASPLVSKQDGAAYVYFTVNWNPSGLYRYRIGDDAVDVVYTPADANQDYCMSSVVAGADGSLYYINDSGSLFALMGAPSWRVRFDARDGSVPATVFVKKGHAVAAPDDPVRAGYEFVGWFIDEACERAWSFDQPVSSDLTLFAKWMPAGGPIDPDDGQDAGGQQGGGDAGSGGSASADGLTGATSVLPGVAPSRGTLGSVAPGRRPLSGRVAVGAASIAGSSSGTVGEPASHTAKSVSGPVLERDGRASAGDGMATVMAVLGIAGVVGLLATGGWLAISAARRRR